MGKMYIFPVVGVFMRDFKLSFLNNCVFVVASIALCASLFACGGDSGTSSNNEEYVSSSSTPRHDVKQSSSNKASSSSWSEAIGSSNSKQSSSSVILSSSRHSGPDPESSSSFEPFDHFKCLADNWNIRDTIYKQFTDTRNGRSYYYFTAYSSKTGRKVTVMAENLNIGKMVLGSEEQNDDNEIERYCYDNDPAMCDKYGGLYQWAEMMQLPSNCNTESCWMKIRRDHQGICPEGWRLFTWDDFVIVKEFYDKYDDGITPRLRSQCFVGYNTSGFSLIGAGLRMPEGRFVDLIESAGWFYPDEVDDNQEMAHAGFVSRYNDRVPQENDRDYKTNGYSVRCVKIE